MWQLWCWLFCKGLKNHKMIQHEGIRYDCNMCKYRATTKDSLRKHGLIRHEGERYPWKLYEYQGTTKNNLKKHKETKHDMNSP